MAEVTDLLKDLETLEANGLPKEKAKEVFSKAMGFIFEVDHRRREEYLSEETQKTYGKTLARLAELAQKYPGTRGVIAHFVLEEVKKEGELKAGRILQLCDRGVRLGTLNEWTYLGKEVGKWRIAGAEKGEVGIHPRVLNAGVHVFDFRPENRDDRRMRHFLASDWHNGTQLELAGYLAEQLKKANEAYKAAHPKPQKAAPVAEAKAEETLPQLNPEEVPPPEKSTKKTKKTHREPEERAETPKANKIAKTKGGRSGAKAETRQEAEEES